MTWNGSMANSGDTTVQQAVIGRVPEVLAADDRILAGWLVGSFATGRADAYSDIDLHCLITDVSADWFRENWARIASDLVSPLVLAQAIPGIIGGYVLSRPRDQPIPLFRRQPAGPDRPRRTRAQPRQCQRIPGHPGLGSAG
jgi:hypothetical protein